MYIDGVTESQFIQVFEKSLPEQEDTFNTIMTQLDSAAKHLRNVEFALALTKQTQSQQVQYTYEGTGREIESEKASRVAGCINSTKRGCNSACMIM